MNPPPWLALLAGLPNRYHTETRMHAAVAAILYAGAVPFKPEHRFNRSDRIDFFIETAGRRIGIECKTKGSSLSIARQVYRYADHLDDLILVTSKPLAIASGPLTTTDRRTIHLHVIELWKNPT